MSATKSFVHALARPAVAQSAVAQPAVARRPRRSRMWAVGPLLAAGLLLAGIVGGGQAAMAADGSASGACADSTGVSVVVDFTELGGAIEAGCAQAEPESGRAALLAAGFTATDSEPGFLCAINSMPDPCPTTFDGSYWSYWHSSPDGEWTSYEVGADSSDPAPGELEGWRYNDGAAGPGIAPAAVAEQLQATPAAESPAQAVDPAGTSAQANTLLIITIVFVGVVILIAVLVFVRARRRANGDG